MSVIKGDEPIKRPEDDAIDRALLATTIADVIRSADVSEGSVVGILGPWGSGKTSLVNLIKVELAKEPEVALLDFNPWMFSGTQQLVDEFFVELAARLRMGPRKWQNVANDLASYGKRIAPLQVIPGLGQVIAGVSGTAQLIEDLTNQSKKAVTEQREKIVEGLRKLDSPLVVVIDDIDRLSPSEIREIFKLVRLVASFPNILYLVAFDRARVEQALKHEGLPGRDYLEKIIQAAFDIPAVPDTVIESQITSAINAAVEGIEAPGPFDQSRWSDVFTEVIFPLFRNMRDVRRYAASLRGTVRSLGGQVALVDVLALEAIRVFLPDLFTEVSRRREALTNVSTNGRRDDPREQERTTSIRKLVQETEDPADPATGATRPSVAEPMVERLFPAAIRHLRNEEHGSLGEWLSARRVAHPFILDYYLDRVAGLKLRAFWVAERALDQLAGEEEFEAFLRSLDPSTWEDVVFSLTRLEDKVPVTAVETATVVLLNLLPEFPERSHVFGDYDARQKVEFVVLGLLRRLPTRDEVERVVQSALPKIRALSGKRVLVSLVGHDEHAGAELVSPESSRALEASLREEILATPPEALATDPDVFWLLVWVRRTAEPAGLTIEFPTRTALDCALLKGSASITQSQFFGTSHIRAERTLNWDVLVDLVGGEDAIRRMLQTCRAQGEDAALREVIGLAEQYLDGRRPGRY